MEYLSWPWVFIGQGIMGLVALVVVLMTPESHTPGAGEPISYQLQSYGRILRNYRLMGIIACNALIALPLFAFIAGSSTIYISGFGLNETLFALFFGANAFCFMAGSMTCMHFGKKIGTMRMITVGYGGVFFGGMVMLAGVFSGPWQFAIPMGMVTFCLGLSRPPSNNLALEQVEKDAGTASSTMVFSYFICGALAMLAVSMDWPSKIVFTGLLAVLSGLGSFGIWFFLKDRLSIRSAEEGVK
jgi:DHA1 family bicyclomycin/chloramphenicol resistance-like MFS transporter